MPSALRSVTPKLFRNCSSKAVVFKTSSDDSLDARDLRSFLSTVMSEGAIGISASYQENCQLSAIAFSSPSRALVVHFSSGDLLLGNNEKKRKRIIQGRSLLQEQILCNANYQKYAFGMDRIAIALYLDVALRIDDAVDMLPVSFRNRRSLRTLMNAMGCELTLHKPNVKALFFDKESHLLSDSDLHMAVLANIFRDGELLDSLKALSMKNDVMPDIAGGMDSFTLTCSRYPTRIRASTQQFLQIETRNGAQVPGRTVRVEGRQARIQILGTLQDDEIKSVITIGKADLTSAEACRESVILSILNGELGLLSNPFFKTIWLPDDPIHWPPSEHVRSEIPICCGDLKVNASQERAIEKILSVSDEDRVVLIRGAPGTGKTTVITAAVTSVTSFPAAHSRTFWIAAQSNVAHGFYDFALLVSKEFHFGWRKHFYEKLQACLICSDTFSDNIDGASEQLRESRIILCTLGMLSNDKIAPFVHVTPVDVLIFDEGSQIEVGNYLPVLHRFINTLTKIVFIGDPKQIPTLQSIFEVKHLRKEVIFLDTQYRMPSAISDLISQKVYNARLKTCHANSIGLPCRFVDFRRGQEEPSGTSWVNPAKAGTVVRIADAYQAKGRDFRIVTPYDAQRALIEHELEAANLEHDDKIDEPEMVMHLLALHRYPQPPITVAFAPKEHLQTDSSLMNRVFAMSDGNGRLLVSLCWLVTMTIVPGSLFALLRSGHNSDSPHGLGFLEAVMSELVNEAEALQADVEVLRKLSQSLETFNESFASFLYVMNINALPTDWLQAPTDASFRLARRMAEENARIAAEASSKAGDEAPPTPPPDMDADKIAYTENADYKMMFMINTANVTSTRQL
ncbi:P-loop containing nucleoside triphosphate hydrolase protein [Pisolithus croceorrhizus]|nr:P-loop containing nucleoside triphosphate hydrolase protein [Pisolithus croceorrhizus]